MSYPRLWMQSNPWVLPNDIVISEIPEKYDHVIYQNQLKEQSGDSLSCSLSSWSLFRLLKPSALSLCSYSWVNSLIYMLSIPRLDMLLNPKPIPCLLWVILHFLFAVSGWTKGVQIPILRNHPQVKSSSPWTYLVFLNRTLLYLLATRQKQS